MFGIRDIIPEKYVSDEDLSSTVLLLFLFIYVIYYLVKVRGKPKLIGKENGPLKKFVEENIPIVKETYWPTIWCFESRCQTLFRSLVKNCPPLQYRREYLTLHDGGEIVLDWADNESSHYTDADTRPTVLLLPGLTGCSKESYIKHYVQQTLELGYRAVVFNYRGNGGCALKTPRTYCASNVGDLTEVVEHVKATNPNAPLMASGTSLGGMILFNYLAKHGSNTPLEAGMLVSVAWNVPKSCSSLERPINRFLFNRTLTLLLIAAIKRNADILAKQFNLDRALRSQTLREFDSSLTAQMFGYPDVDAYYKDATLSFKIDKIKIPLFCLAAADDPFAPGHTLPLEEIAASDYVTLLLTSYGGHIGFLEGAMPTGANFMDRAFRHYAKSVVNNLDRVRQLRHQEPAPPAVSLLDQ